MTVALREAGSPSRLVAVDYLELLAEVKPEVLELAGNGRVKRLEVSRGRC